MPVEINATMQVLNPTNASEWNEILSAVGKPHILQSLDWAELKRPNGWQPIYCVWADAEQKPLAAVVVHQKMLPSYLGGCILYCPRGPILDWSNQPLRHQVLTDLARLAEQERAIFIKIDPEIAKGWSHNPLEGISPDLVGGEVENELDQKSWQFSSDQLQFRNTVLLDLQLDKSSLLANMKQKTRYNIRLAQKKGVVVRLGKPADLENLYLMYAQTSLRDGFAIRSKEYYLDVWTRLMNVGIAYPLIAEVDRQAVSALVLFVYGSRGYYFYGMSTEEHRDKMPNHLLQWEAICLSKKLGCTVYDFWGAPDDFNPDDSMYGVYKFKEGFNGQVMMGLGAWDLVIKQVEIYLVYPNPPYCPPLDAKDWQKKSSTGSKYMMIPRIKIAHLPTPVEHLANLSGHLGGSRLLIKRDDLTGLAMGGNKIRKLEFLLAEAMANGAKNSDNHRCHTIQPLPANSSGCSQIRFGLHFGIGRPTSSKR